MNKVNRKLEYALLILSHMSNQRAGTRVSAREVADLLKLSFDSAAKVMSLLAQKKILLAAPGTGGGYILAADLDQLSLLSLSEAVNGPTPMVPCFDAAENCDWVESCSIRRPLSILQKKSNQFFQSVRVRELMGSN